MDKKDNPMSRLMELAAPYKGEYVLSVILAILGVAAGLLPFFAVSKIVILLMDGETSVSVYMEWCLIAGIGFLGKVCFANFSTLVSHTATFATLAEIRLKLADKLTRVPMGYMINTPSGELKNVLVDRVEGMETTLAHADKIVVVKDGQIIGEGTHENLLTSCMLYQEMWKAHMDTKDVA